MAMAVLEFITQRRLCLGHGKRWLQWRWKNGQVGGCFLLKSVGGVGSFSSRWSSRWFLPSQVGGGRWFLPSWWSSPWFLPSQVGGRRWFLLKSVVGGGSLQLFKLGVPSFSSRLHDSTNNILGWTRPWIWGSNHLVVLGWATTALVMVSSFGAPLLVVLFDFAVLYSLRSHLFWPMVASSLASLM